MSVTLRKRKNSDGTTSLLLDIYNDGSRKYEFLKELKLQKVSGPADTAANKDKLQLAKNIALKRAHELAASDYDMTTEIGKKTIVTDWMQAFIDKYKKKDKRNMQGALNRFRAFLIEEKKQGLVFGALTELVISNFQDYLRAQSIGEGASSYFNRFKKMVRQAYRQKLIANNPAAEVKTVMGTARKKDVLTLEEIKLLSTTSTESSEVKRAFLFSCLTGLRWIDVSGLKWEWIDTRAKMMTVPQSKTDKEVTIPLNNSALKLLGKPGKSDQTVFTLPTANGANKTVKAWVKRAGIKKKITWHNARHSFGTNLIYFDVDLITASAMLGHTTLKYTQRYVKTAKELKERATDKLNFEIEMS